MTDIKLYNTATRSKVALEPLDPDNVRMYVCGPTVYDRAHLGNARPAIVFDVLFRLLRHVYGPEHVTYVRNFTDVDDKINAKAAQTGRDIGEITDETIGWYLEDMAAVGVLEPTHMPRATQWIAPMVAMIEDLIAKGHAYEAEGHVLFRVRSYAGYGKLSGRSVDDMISGARVEVAPYKEDPLDFVLWKPSDDATPGWEGPALANGKKVGRGRPGWHIECSAMAAELLGESFDIHGGGNDLTFPHHENEIAQSRCMGHGFAQVWMHNEMLQVEGKKMSKSLGNFFTVRDLLEQGVPGEVIRFVMLSTHYRKPMDWTEKKWVEAERVLDRLTDALNVAIQYGRPPSNSFDHLPQGMKVTLANDLDTWGARQVLVAQGETLVSAHNGNIVGSSTEGLAISFLTGLEVLGMYELLVKRSAARKNQIKVDDDGFRIVFDVRVFPTDADKRNLLLALQRWRSARLQKDFATADKIKAVLQDAGIEARAVKEGVEADVSERFKPARLEQLL